MILLKKRLWAISLLSVAGVAVFETNQVIEQRETIQQLRREIEQLDGEVAGLREANAEVLARKSVLESKKELFQEKAAEVYKLRGEVSLLRADASSSGGSKLWPKVSPSLVSDSSLTEWSRRTEELKTLLKRFPDKAIPELNYLREEDWLEAAKDSLKQHPDAYLENEAVSREILSAIRAKAKIEMASRMVRALNRFREAHEDELPKDILELGPYFQEPVDDTILGRYEMLRSGKFEDVPLKDVEIIGEKSPVDELFDTRLAIGKHWYMTSKEQDGHFWNPQTSADGPPQAIRD